MAALIFGGLASAQVDQSSLTGGYVLTQWSADGGNWHQVSGAAPTLQLSNGQLQGNSGCNAYSGAYAAGEGNLRVSGLRGGLQACSGAALTQETAYLDGLRQARSYAVNGGALTLSTPAGGQLVFQRQMGQGEVVNQSIRNPVSGQWQLVSPAGSPVQLNIQGSDISGNDGCNQFNAKVNFSGGRLRLLGPVTATRMACSGGPSLYTMLGAGSETDEGAQYQLSGDTFTLTRGAQVWRLERR